MHILDKIVAFKKKEVAAIKEEVSISDLEKSNLFHRTCNSYVERLQLENATGVIAEFKRKSPSKSAINLDANLSAITQGYAKGGVDAISILTDEHFFGGNNSFLQTVRKELPSMPLLRKEFIIDEYQVIEAKSIGADIILLICEILTKEEVAYLSRLARSLGMEVLLELHSEDQIDKYSEHVTMVGVNNRDLTTFSVDYERSKKLFDLLPTDVPKVAESGLSEASTVAMLYNYGFTGFLIGEQFMKQNDPGVACQKFIKDFVNLKNK
ncbi:UNVERIFIED_CONTAM: hypothetical protein GTU68_031850 [Idotea baltica]|nr:hypothetical protein [Idotea baltica]